MSSCLKFFPDLLFEIAIVIAFKLKASFKTLQVNGVSPLADKPITMS